MSYEIKDVDESYCDLVTDDIQFKKKVIDTLSIFEEGYQYNPLFRAGVWNGKKEFYSITQEKNIRFPKGLVDYIIKDLKKSEYPYTYERQTEPYVLDMKDFEDFVETLNIPFKPYDYQIKASYDMITLRRLTLRSATSCLDPETKVKTKLSKEDLEFLRKNYQSDLEV